MTAADRFQIVCQPLEAVDHQLNLRRPVVVGPDKLQQAETAALRGKMGHKTVHPLPDARSRTDDAVAFLDLEIDFGLLADIADQIIHLILTETGTKKSGGHALQVMGFVENHRLVAREYLPKPSLAQSQVGKIEMMVDHQNPGRGRSLSQFIYQAVGPFRTVAAETLMAVSRYFRPQWRSVGQPVQFSTITEFGLCQPALDFIALLVPHQRNLGRIAMLIPTVQAEIILTPFYADGGHLPSEHLFQQRDLFFYQLILQIYGGGGNHHPHSRSDSRHQIGETFADAGLGLDHQHIAVLRCASQAALRGCQKGGNLAGHQQLVWSGLVVRYVV